MKEQEAELVLVHGCDDEPVGALVRVGGEPVALLSAAAIKAMAHELHDWEVIVEYRRGVL
jgi:hypothetical protein